MATLWNFGDSWANAWNARDPDYPCGATDLGYGYTVAHKLKMDFVDMSAPGHSLACVLNDFKHASYRMQAGDVALVTVPPDVRWLTVDNGRLVSLSQNRKEYYHFLKSVNADPAWFVYFNALFLEHFVYSAQQKNIKLIMWHNYGYLDLPEWCDLDLIAQHFVNLDTSMWDYLGYKMSSTKPPDDHYDPYDFRSDGPSLHVVSPYAAKDDNHPNAAGHKLIAERIYAHISNK